MALRKFITHKYGLLNLWTTEEVLGTFGCSVLKTIRRMWPNFNTNMSIKVGDGMKTDFWNEHWIGEGNLKAFFSEDLHIITLQKMPLSLRCEALKDGA